MVIVAETIVTHAARERPITHRVTGQQRGPSTQLFMPDGLGEELKPFIALDRFEIPRSERRGFAPHPHSGMATLTLFLEGAMTYADTTAKVGALHPGAVEWMRAGKGIWHAGAPAAGESMSGFQLWVALPPELELAEAESIYLESASIVHSGPARVILGEYGGQRSPIHLPFPITYLHVILKAGDHWIYTPAAEHDLAFLALTSGSLRTAGTLLGRELAVFADGNAPIKLVAEEDAEFVIGSARRHPYPLVMAGNSIHTNPAALREGERELARLGQSELVANLRH